MNTLQLNITDCVGNINERGKQSVCGMYIDEPLHSDWEAFHGKLLLCATTFWVAPTHFLLFCWSWYKCLPGVCLVWVGVKRSVVDSELSTSCLFQNSEWSLNSVAHSSLCCKHTRAGKQIVRADEIIMMSSNKTTTTVTSHADKTIQQYLSFILISDTLWFTTNKAASSPALLAHEQAT